jgi:hypothetical protein
MTKLHKSAILAAFAVLALGALGGCFDAEPAEIGMHTTVSGQARSCIIQVWNDKGRQIQQEHSDENGVAYIKGLPPGTYTLKFQGSGDQMYPAVRTLTVEAGGNAYLAVDLNQAEDKSGEAAAGGGSSGGSGGGGDD